MNRSTGIKIYSISELIGLAREKSPFYRELYAHLPAGVSDLERLPVLEQDGFWAANALQGNRLLTGPMVDGIIFKSGGTTGNPKFSIFTREEWSAFTSIFGLGLVAGGLKRGERIANIFYSGELYASFLFITQSIEKASEAALQFPIAGSTDPENALKIIRDFKIDVIAGVPTSILALLEYFSTHREKFSPIQIRKVLFGGEAMYPDQRERLAQLFPGIQIQSVGYASVDAGQLGYVDATCLPNEHRTFGTETVIEIIDEDTGLPIQEPGKPGRLIVTNLSRALMPIIRYPAGDRAAWVEPLHLLDRKFVLLGRSDEAARVGPVSMYFEDVVELLAPFRPRYGIQSFQIKVTHWESLDQLVLRIAVSDPAILRQSATDEIRATLGRERPMLKESVEAKRIHPVSVEWIQAQDLVTNPRTGKLRRILDLR